MRVALRSTCLKSSAMALPISSATAPASSQPVGPPPTITTVCKKLRSPWSRVCSACSMAINRRRRISEACSRIFMGGAMPRQSSWPK